jgi:hypothetical protein
MKTINVYTYDELSNEAQAVARENYRKRLQACGDYAWMDEIYDSCKKLFEAAGVAMRDYQLGSYRSDITAGFSSCEVEELNGGRAMAWVENNLLSGLRIPWRGAGRWRVAKYGSCYRPGLVPPCPFTGYCADDDLLDALIKSVREGDTLREAFEGLAQVVERLVNDEIESQLSDEYMGEHLSANDCEFLESGREV